MIDHLQGENAAKEDIEMAYYKAILQMQQRALQLQHQKLEEARKQTEQQRQQIQSQADHYNRMMKCPRYGSTSLAANKKGYGIGKGIIGARIFGSLGLMAGNIGAQNVTVTCMRCGYQFKPRKTAFFLA